MYNSSVVRSTVSETKFGMYTDSELRNMSVCKVTSPLARDALGNPLNGGLYDPRMGATEMGQHCSTCGIHHVGCPGHPGHIELDFPVYHPLVFADLYQLVRSSCFCCHKLRMSKSKIWTYLAKLKLLEMDDVAAADDLDNSLLTSTLLSEMDQEEEEAQEASEGNNSSSGSVKATLAKQKASQQQSALRRTEILEGVDKRYLSHLRANAVGGQKPPSIHAKQKQRAVVTELTKDMHSTKKCNNCGEWSPGVRKDGYSKLFAKPLAKKYRRRSVVNKNLYGQRTALEEVRYMAEREKRRQQRKAQGLDPYGDDDDDKVDEDDMDIDNTLAVDIDDDDDEAGTGISDSDKYLVPLEVEAILRLLWTHHTEMLDFVWSRATKSSNDNVVHKANVDGYKAFFMRCVLVAPNRFRPEAKVGDATSDHPQNKNLAKIIESNDAIAELARKYSNSNSGEPVEATGGSLRNLIASGSPNKAMTGNVAAIPMNTSDKIEKSFLSQSVYLWTQLQNSVNCYIDSAKDPNPLSNSAPAGIRQLLEKKEGLFRMNMMGKRVNYCCRSVISPDPYIGQNEIGIPVKFAKTLHYPTPVNEWNAKHLRTLVERGPHQYPGT
jgi:DNA-directed RNA polymerase I subunit RPA1